MSIHKQIFFTWKTFDEREKPRGIAQPIVHYSKIGLQLGIVLECLSDAWRMSQRYLIYRCKDDIYSYNTFNANYLEFHLLKLTKNLRGFTGLSISHGVNCIHSLSLHLPKRLIIFWKDYLQIFNFDVNLIKRDMTNNLPLPNYEK